MLHPLNFLFRLPRIYINTMSMSKKEADVIVESGEPVSRFECGRELCVFVEGAILLCFGRRLRDVCFLVVEWCSWLSMAVATISCCDSSPFVSQWSISDVTVALKSQHGVLRNDRTHDIMLLIVLYLKTGGMENVPNLRL
jgi:hypothetical protein